MVVNYTDIWEGTIVVPISKLLNDLKLNFEESYNLNEMMAELKFCREKMASTMVQQIYQYGGNPTAVDCCSGVLTYYFEVAQDEIDFESARDAWLTTSHTFVTLSVIDIDLNGQTNPLTAQEITDISSFVSFTA